MRGFQDNNCRLCPKVFCCKNCRLKHEKNVHKVFPDCDICIYGQLILENIDDCFLKHLESSHLPLHCNYCRKIFSSIEDLLQHRKCTYSHIKELSPKTPFKTPPAILVAADDQDSPILQDLQRQELLNYILATSTPMHRGEEPNLFEKSKQEAITPVDKPLKESNKSIIKKTDLKSDGQLSKRRVTFGGTSTSFSDRKLDESRTDDQENIPDTGNTVKLLDAQSPSFDQKPNNETTPVTGPGSDQFYSAKTETAQFFSAKTDLSSQSTRESSKARNMEEGCTPVGIPNKSKLNNAKGNIYNKHDQQNSDILGQPMSGASDNTKSQDNLSVSIDLCTTPGPAKSLNALEDRNKSNVLNQTKSQDTLSKVFIELCTPGSVKSEVKRLNASEDKNKSNVSDQIKNQGDLSKVSMELCTPGPAKRLNSSEDKDKSNVSGQIKNQDNLSKVSMRLCTPGPGKRLNALKDKNNSNVSDQIKNQDNLSEVSIELFTPESAISLNESEEKNKSSVSDQTKSQDNLSEVCSMELFTPESAICLNESKEKNKSSVSDQTKSQDNLSEVSMELCTPAIGLNTPEDISPAAQNIPEKNETNGIIDLCTPARTTNPVKIIKGDIYKNTPFRPSTSIESKGNDSTDRQNKSEENPITKEMVYEEPSHAGHDTLWLSAINIDESNQSKSPTSENKSSFEEIKPLLEKRSPTGTTESPERTNARRVSIVIPTPIVKTTSVQMKFNIPAHMSSTPILQGGLVNFQQTKIVQDISSRILQQQTPFKTPQGKLSEFVQRKLVDNKLRRNLAPLSVVEPGPFNEDKDLILENITEEHSREPEICKEVVAVDSSTEEEDENEYQDTFSSVSEGESGTGISVSSMTESSLWSSMTKMVRSVLGGLTNISQDSINDMSKSKNSSFKRPRMGDSTEEPRMKRFKFTDIKCRRAIRDLPAITLYHQPSTEAPMASIEIKRSVSTVYGQQTIRIQCDKATQTDNYLMYGWQPQV